MAGERRRQTSPRAALHALASGACTGWDNSDQQGNIAEGKWDTWNVRRSVWSRSLRQGRRHRSDEAQANGARGKPRGAGEGVVIDRLGHRITKRGARVAFPLATVARRRFFARGATTAPLATGTICRGLLVRGFCAAAHQNARPTKHRGAHERPHDGNDQNKSSHWSYYTFRHLAVQTCPSGVPSASQE